MRSFHQILKPNKHSFTIFSLLVALIVGYDRIFEIKKSPVLSRYCARNVSKFSSGCCSVSAWLGVKVRVRIGFAATAVSPHRLPVERGWNDGVQGKDTSLMSKVGEKRRSVKKVPRKGSKRREGAATGQTYPATRATMSGPAIFVALHQSLTKSLTHSWLVGTTVALRSSPRSSPAET